VSCLPTSIKSSQNRACPGCFNSPREVSCLPTPATTAGCILQGWIVSIPHGKCPVCRRRTLSPGARRHNSSFQFPTGSVLSADETDDGYVHLECIRFQFPTGSVLSADGFVHFRLYNSSGTFQFPTGSVLSADVRASGWRKTFPRCFNSPREVSCLPTYTAGMTRCFCCSSFNSPREVSCLPTSTAATPARLTSCFNSPREVSCLPTRPGRQGRQDADRRFNSPREVSCLPTSYANTASARSRMFQFPTGSVLSADEYLQRLLEAGVLVSIPHGKCPVCRPHPITGIPSSSNACFNSPREVSCLPTRG